MSSWMSQRTIIRTRYHHVTSSATNRSARSCRLGPGVKDGQRAVDHVGATQDGGQHGPDGHDVGTVVRAGRPRRVENHDVGRRIGRWRVRRIVDEAEGSPAHVAVGGDSGCGSVEHRGSLP